MKQIFVDDQYDYDYQEVDGVHTLYYSNSSSWTNHTRGEIALQIEDHGNGLSIQEFKKEIDYSEASQLLILLKIIEEPTKYEIGKKELL